MPEPSASAKEPVNTTATILSADEFALTMPAHQAEVQHRVQRAPTEARRGRLGATQPRAAGCGDVTAVGMKPAVGRRAATPAVACSRGIGSRHHAGDVTQTRLGQVGQARCSGGLHDAALPRRAPLLFARLLLKCRSRVERIGFRDRRENVAAQGFTQLCSRAASPPRQSRC